MEVRPGTIPDCPSMKYIGLVNDKMTIFGDIDKGYIGNFIFADDSAGHCNERKIKANSWVSCENSKADEAYFNICP